MRDDAVRVIESSVRELLSRRQRLVLAVSGGADSAVLLDAVARLRSADHQIIVASVDHGTGDAATEATALALSVAARAALPAISERLTLAPRDEATLRDGRWKFLRRVAATFDAVVVTAHSLDDHIETVVMRVLRGSSARGLAGLLAQSEIERPLLEHRRSAIRAYATTRRVAFLEDPTNASLGYFRNRVRLQLLPSIRSVRPEFEQNMIDLSRRAARLRQEVDEIANEFVVDAEARELPVRLDAGTLRALPDESLRVVLPALAARSGATLDRRGLSRLASVVRSASGTRGQLSGGFEAIRGRNDVTIMRPTLADPAVLRLREKGETKFGSFRFQSVPGASILKESTDAWRISIPRSAEPVVRQWHPGDRLTIDLKGSRRKVKRFFADAGVVGPMRVGWPVVICGEDVVWIPGIKSSQDAVRREAKMVHYTCERIRD